MIAPVKAFLVFGSHATHKNDREFSSLRMGLGRYILVEKNVFVLAQPRVCFLKCEKLDAVTN